MGIEITVVYGTVISVLFGVCVYFLKQTMDTVKGHTVSITKVNEKITEDYSKKDDVKESVAIVQEAVNQVAISAKKDTDALAKDVASIKDKYLTKEDFYRSQADTNQKLDKIYDLILEMKGGTSHG